MNHDIERELEARGCGVLEKLLTPAQCDELAALYADEARFRSRVVMARHGFGQGEYKYFRYPLPELPGSAGRSPSPGTASPFRRYSRSTIGRCRERAGSTG